jgi:predicted permease
MRRLRALGKRLAGMVGAGPADQEFDAELESHLQMHIEENLRSGMSAEEARRQAILKLGGLEQTKQAYRERTTIPSLESFVQDAHFGLRILARRPGSSMVIVLVLALGIGANTAMFSIVSAVMLRPLPYRNSDRLVLVWQSSKQHRSTGEWFNTYREFEQWERSSRSFEKMAALSWAVGGKTLVWHGKPQDVLAIPASVDFFSMLGVPAALGRTFEQHDLSEGCTTVLSHAFWQNELGAPAALVGQSVSLDQHECRVIGIMPKTFSFYPAQTALWMLITPDSSFVKDPWRSVTGVFGRLKPGTSRVSAESELETLERNMLPEAPTDLSLPQAVPVVLDLQSEFTWLAGRNLRTALMVLLAAVLFVLLIACVNVANLLLAKAADRQKEFAIRASLGAGRARLIRQLLMESGLLSLGGAFLGALMAWGAVSLFAAKSPIELPPGNPVVVNWQVLGFAALLAILCAVLFGLIPAWKASRLDLNEALKEAGQSFFRSKTSRRAGSLMIAAEVGLALILLVGAGLLIQSLRKFASTPLGFRTDHLLTGSIQLPQRQYRDPDQKIQFFDRLVEQVASIPGVKGVSLASSLNLTGSNVLAVEDRIFSRDGAAHDVANETVGNNFLEVMAIPLLRGRAFDTEDRENTQPVAVINQALADQYFPGQDPIGHAIKLGAPEDKQRWLTIVGVVGNVKTTTVFQEMGYVVRPAVYQSFLQQPSESMSLLIRTNEEPNAVVDPLNQKLRAIDGDVTLANVKTMEESLSESQSQPRFRTILLSGFAALALVLAALGIYGVLTQSVVRRTREIGVRMALGASRRSVTRMVLRQAFTMVLVGIGAGLAGTVVAARFVVALLYDVRPNDPLTLAGVSALLVAVAMVASYLPARRATAIDPVKALRNE